MKTLTSLKVLVVEDEALVSMLVEDMLTDLGCTIVGPGPAAGWAGVACLRRPRTAT